MKKVSVSGGAPLILGNAPQPSGASWGSQGRIAFASAGVEALQRVAAAGIRLVLVTGRTWEELAERVKLASEKRDKRAYVLPFRC